ncbi:MAG: hypothetical protein H0U66_04270 [Gemmatimonadaceae bacterium]|nr:hypothetical protein [Gemmatimonadaceae bacterium]
MTITSHTAIGMVAAPMLVAIASLIGKRWGVAAGGWFIALPLISGPIVLTYALERGAAFAAQACLGALLAVVSLCAFALAYAWSARRVGWAGSSALACGAFLASSWALQQLRVPSIGWAFLVACAALAIALRLMPPASSLVRGGRPAVWELPVRIALAASLVWALAAISSAAGPRVSGLLTPFPITSLILVAFIHRHERVEAVSQYLRGLLKGLFSFAIFVIVVGVAIGSWTIAATFLVATIATLAFHAGVWHWVQQQLSEPRIFSA